MNIKITRTSDDTLSRKIYRFDIFERHDGIEIRATFIGVESRASTRHRKWIKIKHWDNARRRDSNLDDLTIPQDVLDEARARVVESISFRLPEAR